MIAYSDKAAASKSSGNGESKKARVLRLAQTDPFLSVDEIARKVGTTSRYVRTSLSEAGLTLTELRRRFARDVRKRLSGEDSGGEEEGSVAVASAPSLKALDQDDEHEETRCVRVSQVVDVAAASLLGTAPDTPLLEISRLRVLNGQPLYVNQLVTNQYLTVSEQMLAEDGPLYNLLRRVTGDAARPMLARRTVDIVPATEYLAESLGVQPGHPLLRSGTVITVGPDDTPLAVEFSYFDAMRVRLELETASRRAWRVIERAHPD